MKKQLASCSVRIRINTLPPKQEETLLKLLAELESEKAFILKGFVLLGYSTLTESKDNEIVATHIQKKASPNDVVINISLQEIPILENVKNRRGLVHTLLYFGVNRFCDMQKKTIKTNSQEERLLYLCGLSSTLRACKETPVSVSENHDLSNSSLVTEDKKAVKVNDQKHKTQPYTSTKVKEHSNEGVARTVDNNPKPQKQQLDHSNSEPQKRQFDPRTLFVDRG